MGLTGTGDWWHDTMRTVHHLVPLVGREDEGGKQEASV